MSKKLLPLIPPHHIYCEPFGGGASLLFAKDPSPVEIYNDLDSGLVNFFRVLRDEKLFAKFYLKVSLAPYAREERDFSLASWETCNDVVEKAFRWFVIARSSFSGLFGNSWGYSFATSHRGMSAMTSKWLSIIDLLPTIYRRFMSAQVEHLPAVKIIEKYDSETTFFYCDPPYLPETRLGGGYRHEMASQDHEQLLNVILRSRAKFLISGYNNDRYNLKLKGWKTRSWTTVCRAVGSTRRSKFCGEGARLKNAQRVEKVWLNYDP